MLKKDKWKTFLILLGFSIIIAFSNRLARMVIVTYPLWEFHLATFSLYMSMEEIAAIKNSILVWATSRVILVDTLFNMFYLYTTPFVLRVFAKKFSIKGSLKLHNFFKGDYK